MSCRGTSIIGRWGTAIVLAFALAALWLPAGASAADGAIKGEVTLASGGAPVNEAAVCAEFESPPYSFKCGYTDADGLYELSELTPGEYVVEFYAGKSGKYLMHQVYDGVSRWSEATEVTVASGAPTEGIDAALVEGGAIAGRVTDAVSGEPIDEVVVCSWLESGEETEACAETGSDGTYEIVGVAPGPNAVEFFAFEQDYDPKVLHGISVSAGVEKPNVNAALVPSVPPNGRMGGHVYAAATHLPLGGVSVCAIDEFGESRGCANTSKAGAYEFIQVPPGSWRIAFSPDPSEFEAFEPGEIKADSWPTQFWNLKPTLAEADVIDMVQNEVKTSIDGLLGPGPASSTGLSKPVVITSLPAPVAVTPKPKTMICKKGFVKKHLRGKQHCVRLRKHRRHHHHERHHR